jgi:hypothetical protein
MTKGVQTKGKYSMSESKLKRKWVAMKNLKSGHSIELEPIVEQPTVCYNNGATVQHTVTHNPRQVMLHL